MPKLHRFASLTISVGIAAYVLPKLIFFLEQDDCLDSGGALNSAGVCVVETGSHYSPIYGPQTPYIAWLILFGVASIMILGVSKVASQLFSRLFTNSSSDDPAT